MINIGIKWVMADARLGQSVEVLFLLCLRSCTRPNPYLGICGNGVHEPHNDGECGEGGDHLLPDPRSGLPEASAEVDEGP